MPKSVSDFINESLNTVSQNPIVQKVTAIVNNTPNKQEEVKAATTAKQTVMGQLPTDYQMAVGKFNNVGGKNSSELENDIRNMPAIDLYAKYGDAATDMIRTRAIAGTEVLKDKYSTLTSPVTDNAISAANAAVGTVTGIGSLATGLVNDNAGAYAATKSQQINDYLKSLQSDALQQRQKVQEAANVLTERDNLVDQYSDIEKGKNPLIAGLERVGKDAVNSVSIAASDGATLSEGLSSAVGSMYGVGKITQGLKALGSVVIPKATQTGIGVAAALDYGAGTPSVARALTALGKEAPVYTAIAGTEGGGAYQQVVNEVMNKDHATLMRENSDYKNLIKQGISQEDAKSQIANKTGLTAAAITAPLAAVTGTLVHKFAGNPFGAKSANEALNSIIREPIEEGIQGGIGQTAQNYAEQVNGNANKDIYAGVGRQIGEGALYGLGSAGIAAIPSIAKIGTDKAVAGVQGAIQSTKDLVRTRLDNVTNSVNKASPIADEVVSKAATEAQATAPQAVPIVQEAINNLEGTPEQKAEVQNYADKIFSASQFDPSEVRSENASIVDGSTNRVEAIQRLGEVVNNTEPDSKEHITAGLDMYQLLEPYANLVEADPELLSKIPGDHQATGIINQYHSLMDAVIKTPKVAQALSFVQQAIENNKIQPVEITDQNVNNPDIQQQIKDNIALASIAPDKADLNTNEQILLHANKGSIDLTPEQRIALNGSVSLLRAAKLANEEAARLGQDTEVNRVTRNIVSEAGQKGDSAFQYTGAIVKAMKGGNLPAAKDLLKAMGDFTQHMQNKVNAVNEHYDIGFPGKQGVPYEALNSETGKWYTNEKGLKVHPYNKGSVDFVQKMYLDAKTLGDSFNGLVQAFPELGVSPLPVSQLVPALAKPVADVVSAHLNKPKQESTTTEPVKQTVSEKQSNIVESTKQESTLEVKVVEPKKDVVPVEQVKEVTKEEPIKEIEPVKLKGMQAAFPNLIGSENNRFVKSFKLPNEPTTRTVGFDNPIKVITDAFKSPLTFVDFLYKNPTRNFTDALASEYKNYLKLGDGILSILNQNLKQYLDSSYSKSDKRTHRELLTTNADIKLTDGTILKGSDLSATARGKVLSLVDKDTFQYDTQLAESSVLAGLQWLISSTQMGSENDIEDVAKIVGVDPEAVTANMLGYLSEGMSVTEAKQSLSNKLLNYWGVTKDVDGYIGVQQGIAEGMASELLRAFEEQKYISIKSYYITQDQVSEIVPYVKGKDSVPKNSKTVDRIIPEAIEDKSPIHSFPMAIEEAVLISPEYTNYIGNDAKVPLPKTQLRNPLVQNTEQQLDTIKANQETPYYVDTHMANFQEAIGLDGYLKLLGLSSFKSDKANKNHAKSVDGIIRSITEVFKFRNNLLNEIESAGEIDGKSISETPIYYPYNMTKVSRLQQLGRYTPQSNKYLREVILPTYSTLDLSKKSGKDYEAFIRGMAQAIGVNVNKKSYGIIESDITSKLNKEYSESISRLQDWLKNPTEEMPEATVDSLIKDFAKDKNGVSDIGLHALLEYARYLNTDPKEQAKFNTSLYLEADGVANGASNALVLFNTGNFNSQWVTDIAKSGLFFNRPTENLSSYNELVDNKDIYQTATDYLKENISQMRSLYKGNSKVTNQIDNLFILMDEFLGKDLTIDDKGNLFLQRGIIKQPLFISIYGSGDTGIASKLTRTITDAIYERMTDALNNNVQFSDRAAKALNTVLASYPTKKNKQSPIQLQPMSSKRQGNIDLKNFTFDKDELSALHQNIKLFFIEPMRSSINKLLGDPLLNTTKAISKAVQIQSIFLEQAFKDQVALELENKKNDPTWHKGDFLTQKELDGIHKKLEYLAPMIKTGNQTFYIAGSDTTDIAGSHFGYALNNDFRSPAYINAPQNAKSKTIPFLTIGSGDGLAIQLFSTIQDAIKGTLPIFDGINLPLDKIELGSLQANEAIYKTWTDNNILESVYDTFSKFLDNSELVITSEEQRQALMQSLNIFDKVPDEYIIDKIKDLLNPLEIIKDSAIARQRVLAQVPLTVDQMAGAGVSYHNPGKTTLVGTDPVEITSQLNKLYEEELIKLKTDEETKQDISKELIALGTKHSTGVYTLDNTNLSSLLGSLKVTPDVKQVIGLLNQSVLTNNYSVVYGSLEDIQKYHSEKNIDFPDLPESGVNGYISVRDRTVYLVNPSKETLVHEMIHAITFEGVSKYYSLKDDSKKFFQMTPYIQRLEKLMDQFMNIDLSDVTPELSEVYETATSAISDYLLEGTANGNAKALNEFMAWGLSNQNLINLGKKTVVNKLAQISSYVWKLIKNIFLKRKLELPNLGNDLFSNLLFNTSVITHTQPTLQAKVANSVLFQNKIYGDKERLAKVSEAFSNAVGKYLVEPIVSNQRMPATVLSDAIMLQRNIANNFIMHGFLSTKQEADVFENVVTALATKAKIDPDSMLAAQQIYTTTMHHLRMEDLIEGTDAPANTYYAQQKFDALSGKFLKDLDTQGRSTLLPSFLALAIVDDQFRSVLSKIKIPRDFKYPKSIDTFDGYAEYVGNTLMTNLSDQLSGISKIPTHRNKPINVQEAIDALSYHIAEQVQEKETYIDQMASKAGGYLDRVNQIIVDGASQLATKVLAIDEDIQKSDASKYVKAASQLGAGIAAVLEENAGQALSEGLMATINKNNVWLPFQELISDVIGRTKSNANAYDLIKRFGSMIKQIKDQFNIHLPKTIADKFTRKLSKDEWSHLYHGLGRTDIAALFNSFKSDEISKLLSDPKKLNDTIADIENSLKKEDASGWSIINAKAIQLAKYMATYEAAGNKLLKNAYAISNLFGERKPANFKKKSENYISQLDNLISLYAMNQLSQTTRDTLSSLVQTEQDGMVFTMSYLADLRKQEQAKITNDLIKINHQKGYIPSSIKEGVTLIVADDEHFPKLALQSFQRITKYRGSSLDRSNTNKSYYYAPVSSRANFERGTMQNTRQSASGVDAITGLSIDRNAGFITAPTKVKNIVRGLNTEAVTTENLIPVYNALGETIAFERSVDPVVMRRLEGDSNLADVIGSWQTRLAIQEQSKYIETTLVDKLKDMLDYDLKKSSSNIDQYIDVFSSTDPVIRESVSMFTSDTLGHINKTFENGKFLVRKDMLNDAFGYRVASIGDAWTGTSRWSEDTQKTVRDLAISFGGAKAYKIAVDGERILKGVVSNIKNIVVVKSVIVPMSNTISNIFQLIARGVPKKDIIKGMGTKINETNQYMKSYLRQTQLEADLKVATIANDKTKQSNIERELQSLKDSYRRMTIWPLIEAGEFESITDLGVTTDDVALTEGRLQDYIESTIAKLPAPFNTLGRYAIVSRDTALYKILNKAVLYGDFIAKSIIYDDLVLRQKKTKEDALGVVTEEFINHSKLRGRFRGNLEELGLLWFYNYKIRSIKVGLSMIRNNPVHTLFATIAPHPDVFGSVGLPTEDNGLTKLLDGSLSSSIGPGQGLRATTLNPWINLIN